MTANLYPSGSSRASAYKAASALPFPPESGWVLAVAGIGPAYEPELWFPSLSVQSWLVAAGVEIELTKCRQPAVQLVDAFKAMMSLELEHLNAGLPNRERDGAETSLRNLLKGIAESARHLSAALLMIRYELLYRRARGLDCRKLEGLHVNLHEAFSAAQYRNEWLVKSNPPPDRGPLSLHQTRSKRSRTWLEEGCDAVASEASRSLFVEDDYLERMESRPRGVREDFAKGVASAWVEATGVRPTVRGGDEGKLSPFQIFYRLVCAHTAGLLAREADWDKSPTEAQAKFKRRLQRLGLLALPSASTLRRAMKSASEIPPTIGGKDGA